MILCRSWTRCARFLRSGQGRDTSAKKAVITVKFAVAE